MSPTSRGSSDRVAATARHPEDLKPLIDAYGDSVLPLALDVTDRAAAFATVERAARHFGRLDIAVNNAGYGLFGMVEEVTEEQARAQLETNHASKWALEGLSESLAPEVAPLGVKVTIVEPGPYGTDWSGASAVHTEPIAAYEPVREARRAGAANRAPNDPATTAGAILTLVDAPEPPLRLFLGTFPYAVAERAYRDRLATWEAWRAVAETA
jgi:NAD(P)-dependent dehydrogenase (short-subunit alcohol dehydrogenase family)